MLNNIWIGQQTTGAPQGSVHPLTVQEQAAYNATHRIVVRCGDIPAGIAAATALALNCMPLFTGQLASLQRAVIQTPFAIAGNAAYVSTQVEVGDQETATQYLAATETNLNASPNLIKVGTGDAGSKYYGSANSAVPPTPIDAVVITFLAPAAGISLSSMTQGELHLYVNLTDASTPSVA